MPSLIGSLLGGAAVGYGAQVAEEGKAAREAALRSAELKQQNDMAMSREQYAQDRQDARSGDLVYGADGNAYNRIGSKLTPIQTTDGTAVNVPDPKLAAGNIALKTRMENAKAMGIAETDPEYKSYVLTGTLTKATQPTSVAEYNYSVQHDGEKRSYTDWMAARKSPGVVVNTGDAADTNLNKALDTETGKSWAAYLNQGTTSSANLQDFKVLDNLLQVAPQGPLAGNLAKQFPGFSSAGDAVNAIVKRVAPTLRTPGSGSTSDVEYDGFLKSLPDLGTSPAANSAINSMMKAKAQINIDRANVIKEFSAKKISREAAYAKIQEIDARSIMTPEMQSIIDVTPQSQAADPATIQLAPDVQDLVNQYKGK